MEQEAASLRRGSGGERLDRSLGGALFVTLPAEGLNQQDRVQDFAEPGNKPLFLTALPPGRGSAQPVEAQ